MTGLEASLERIIDSIVIRIPAIALGIGLLIAGAYAIRVLLSILNKRFEKRQVDPSLRVFISSALRFVLYAMLILSAASTMGFKTTSFLAVLSAATLAVGLSLQGSLSNFAGGVLILLFKPFRVGDAIQSAAGASGVVERIDILYTTLRTAEGLAIFSPNGVLANSIITNFSDLQSRRAEIKISISDTEKAGNVRELIINRMTQDNRVLKNPAPQVWVSETLPGTQNLVVYFWTAKESYLNVLYEMQEIFADLLTDAGIQRPPASNEIRIADCSLLKNDPYTDKTGESKKLPE